MKRILILGALLVTGCDAFKSEEARQEATLAAEVNEAVEAPSPDSPIGQQVAKDEEAERAAREAEEAAEAAEKEKEPIKDSECAINSETLYCYPVIDNQTGCHYLVVGKGTDIPPVMVPRMVPGGGQYCGQSKLREPPVKTRKQWREEGRDDLADL